MPDDSAEAHTDPASADRRDRRGRLGCLRRLGEPLRQPCVSQRDGGQRFGRAAHRLAAAARGLARRGGERGRGGADVRQVAQLRRIRVRPWLGQRVRAGRRRVLSEAAGSRAVQPGARAASAAPARRRHLHRGRWAAPWCRPAGSSSCPRSMSRSAPRRSGTRLGRPGGCGGWGLQFHWENAGYSTFDDFLGALSSRKRKVLRRERRDANACGLDFRALSGADIQERHWDAFYRFYQSTVDRKWGSRLSHPRVLLPVVRAPRRQGGVDAGGA